MTFLPIVERELRVAARKPGTYWFRFFAALGVIVIWLALVVFSQHSASLTSLGSSMFGTISFLAECVCLASGIFITADCISEEKREGTLGLLFLTDLKGHDVTLGKLAATSVHSLYALLAIFPVLALTLLLGGVSVGEFWRVVLVLMVTLFFSLSTGMFVSTLSRESRLAMGGALLVVALAAVVLPAIDEIIEVDFNHHQTIKALAWPSPFFAYWHAGDNYYAMRGGRRAFWGSLATVFGLGFVMLTCASLTLPRVWQDRTQSARTGPRVKKLTRLRFGSPQLRRSLRTRLLAANPFHWLATRDRLPKFLGWVLFGSLLTLWLCLFAGVLIGPPATRDEAFGLMIFLALGSHVIFKGMVAVEATRRLGDDRRSGALELLLVTPLPEREILAGQQRALAQQFMTPLFVLLFINGALIWLFHDPNPMQMNTEDKLMSVGILLGGMLVLVIDFITLRWVGMWTALRFQKHHRAVLSTLAKVMLLPWLAIFLLIAGTNGMPLSTGDLSAIFALWFVLGIANDLFCGLRARSKLRKGLRHFAVGVSPMSERQPSISKPAALASVDV